MTTTKYMQSVLALFLTITLFAVTNTAFADHEALVAGEVIPLADASLAHGENCDDVHYHGDLNGKEDPNPDGCGHGIVTILPHDEDDESIIPETETEEEDDSPGFWSKVGNFFANVADVIAQAIGAPAPKTIYDSVEIVEEATPSIMENADNIEEYRDSVDEAEDTLNIYDSSTDGLEEYPLSKRFFDWVWGN